MCFTKIHLKTNFVFSTLTRTLSSFSFVWKTSTTRSRNVFQVRMRSILAMCPITIKPVYISNANAKKVGYLKDKCKF